MEGEVVAIEEDMVVEDVLNALIIKNESYLTRLLLLALLSSQDNK